MSLSEKQKTKLTRELVNKVSQLIVTLVENNCENEKERVLLAHDCLINLFGNLSIQWTTGDDGVTGYYQKSMGMLSMMAQWFDESLLILSSDLKRNMQ